MQRAAAKAAERAAAEAVAASEAAARARSELEARAAEGEAAVAAAREQAEQNQAARLVLLGESNAKLEEQLLEQRAEVERQRVLHAEAVSAWSAGRKAAEEEAQRLREALKTAEAALATASTPQPGALPGAAQELVATQEHEDDIRSLRAARDEQRAQLESRERKLAALQARVKELETVAAVAAPPAAAPAPPPVPSAAASSGMPQLGELQQQALAGELEGWRMVAKEAQEAAATLEEELSVARRELKALGHSGVFDNAAPRARKRCEGVSTAVGTRVPRAASYAGAARQARTGSFLSRHNSHVRL